MEWRQFVMSLESLPPDQVEEVLLRHGAQAVTFTDAGDDPVLEPAPGETPLWNDVRITGLFSPPVNFDLLREDLLRTLSVTQLPDNRIETLRDRAWEREWLKDFRPMRFGRRLWVCPSRFEVSDEGAVVVRLDPGLAFGTGTHPTTALCLQWVDGLDLRNKRVLDYGCGSGILSVASLLLGAASASAFDIDPQAITAARQNAERNNVEDRLVATMDAGSLAAGYDVVVANILATPLIHEAGTICERLVRGGAIALSGIMEHQAAAVAAAYKDRVEFEAPSIKAPWVRLTGKRL
jgi:ribosomal protein L11 methyltransferase